MMRTYERVHKLTASDDGDAFDSGSHAHNHFLQKYALTSLKSGSAKTCVCCYRQEIVGYYTLAVGSDQPQSA